MKKIIIGIIIGVSISSIVGVSAATLYYSNQVSYTPTDTSWNVSDVKSALDELHETQGTDEITKKQYTFTSTSSNLFITKNISLSGKEIISYGIIGISINQRDINHTSGYNFTPSIGIKDFDGTNLTGFCYSQFNYSGNIAYGTITVEVIYK